MKWFSHESTASRDTKLKKLLMKYGAEGYGLYWYCVEHVCANVDPKLTFELEHDSEILAHELKIDTLLVEEMMRYMVSVGLFEESNGIVTCLKLAKHLGENCTRNNNLKDVIKASKNESLSQTVSDSLGQSQIVSAIREDKRREDKRREEKKKETKAGRFTPPTREELISYLEGAGYFLCDPDIFLNHFGSNGWKVSGKAPMKCWKKASANWHLREQAKQRGRSSGRI